MSFCSGCFFQLKFKLRLATSRYFGCSSLVLCFFSHLTCCALLLCRHGSVVTNKIGSCAVVGRCKQRGCGKLDAGLGRRTHTPRLGTVPVLSVSGGQRKASVREPIQVGGLNVSISPRSRGSFDHTAIGEPSPPAVPAVDPRP